MQNVCFSPPIKTGLYFSRIFLGFQIGISENFGLCPERTPINCRNPYNKNRTFIADFLQRYRKQNKDEYYLSADHIGRRADPDSQQYHARIQRAVIPLARIGQLSAHGNDPALSWNIKNRQNCAEIAVWVGKQNANFGFHNFILPVLRYIRKMYFSKY